MEKFRIRLIILRSRSDLIFRHGSDRKVGNTGAQMD